MTVKNVNIYDVYMKEGIQDMEGDDRNVSVITIDGPSGVGKSTLCKAIATILKWNILDSGAIYRTLALVAINHYVDFTSEETLESLADNLDFRFFCANRNFKIFIRDKDISSEIRTQEVDNIASQIAVFPRVRKALLRCQREFRKKPGLIADGRDMGTVVFHDAPVKIFLNASLEERANRRMLQLRSRGFNVSFTDVLSEIKKRDNRDCNRDISPLMPAKDALVLDSTSLTIEQMIEKVLRYSRRKLNFI